MTDAGFIRIRRRTLTRSRLGRRERTASASYDFVRSVRIDGKPRQKFIFGLGSVKEPMLDNELVYFWAHAFFKMRRQGLSEEGRAELARELIRKGVVLPSRKMCKAYSDFASWQWVFEELDALRRRRAA